MFTGLVEKVGLLSARRRSGGAYMIMVKHEPWDVPLAKGESVAVQGVCLTVTEARRDSFTCDVLMETISKTTFGARPIGSPVNLERALPIDGRLGGHIVTGHVDGIGHVLAVHSADSGDTVLRIGCDIDIMRGIVQKCSVACDGVSLTVSSTEPDFFEVTLIPTTLSGTSLGSLTTGDDVNVETDIIGKYVARYLDGARVGAKLGEGAVDMEKLRNAGFMDAT